MDSNLYSYEAIKSTMKSPKKDLIPNDLLIFKNGRKKKKRRLDNKMDRRRS